MNRLSIFTLKAMRKLYAKAFNVKPLPKPACEQDPDKASQIIYDILMDDKPCMIARFGSNELLTLITYLGIKNSDRNIRNYIKGKSLEWWWNEENLNNMFYVAGFFPRENNSFSLFSELMLSDIGEVDVLGSWLENENYLTNYLQCDKVQLRLLEPFWTNHPWTPALKGKKVLVVHPFDFLIQKQYENYRHKLFKTNNLLPDFELQTLKTVQSHGGENNNFSSWFEALKWMKNEIDKRDYDVCLIGAGAYGFHLAAHVKRQGKKAVHLGGALQLLFGIRGKRWEDPNYGVKEWGIPAGSYSNLMNEYWKRPGDEFKPANANKVEGACYW